jgi:hypothetical protein
MKDKTFIILTGLFFLLFFGGVIAVALGNPITGLFIRASNAVPSSSKSFVVVFPQVGIASDEQSGKASTKIKVTAYLRDDSGTLLSDRSVKISSNSKAVIITPGEIQNTNSIGQAQFFITSSLPGEVELSVIDIKSNIPVANIPTVEFTQ